MFIAAGGGGHTRPATIPAIAVIALLTLAAPGLSFSIVWKNINQASRPAAVFLLLLAIVDAGFFCVVAWLTVLAMEDAILLLK